MRPHYGKNNRWSLSEHEVTPHAVYVKRRTLLRAGSGTGLAGLLGASWWRWANAGSALQRSDLPALTGEPSTVLGARATDALTDWDDTTAYNNFYEFGAGKSDPAAHAHALQTSPWQVQVEGLINKPRTWALDELLKLAPMEERIYRLRCVEGWSMVIPWVGYSLAKLIKASEPQGSAKYLQFVTLADPQTMPGVRGRILDWPYTEGLRMDEALHPLTLLAFGMYGTVLPKQNGAPLRVVVPWKYGFKSAKSIVKIRFTEDEPATAWSKAAPREYGFYSNVNPDVPHPRWSQASERRIGEGGLFAKKRKTLLFNGYEEQVGQLYAGMDLRQYY